MPKGDQTDPGVVTGFKLLTEMRSNASRQTALIQGLSDHLMRFHQENREDHQDIFQGLRTHGERIKANETEIGNLKPKVSQTLKAVNGAVTGQAGMRGELKALLWALGIIGAAVLGAFARGWLGG